MTIDHRPMKLCAMTLDINVLDIGPNFKVQCHVRDSEWYLPLFKGFFLKPLSFDLDINTLIHAIL